MKLKDFFYSREPISRLLVSRWKLNWWIVFLAIAGLGLVDEILIGWILGHWETSQDIIGVVDNFPHIIKAAIVVPAIWAFFVWLPKTGVDFFDALEGNNVLDRKGRKNYRDRVKSLHAFIRSKRLVAMALILTAILTVSAVNINLMYVPAPWTVFLRAHFWIFRVPIILLTTYAFVYAAIWSVTLAAFAYSTFRDSWVKVVPYHEDSAGGLRFVGRLALGVSRLPLVIGIYAISEFLIALTIGQDILGHYNLVGEIIAVPILTLVGFAAPVLSCRKAMTRSKESELGKLAKQISNHMDTLSQDSRVATGELEHLTALIDLQSRLKKDFPTVPFDTSILRGFQLTFLGSTVPALLSFGNDLYGILGSTPE